jgi:Mg2+/Co2+ transporter CorC
MRENAALRDFNPAYVADGSKTALTPLKRDVCITPESRHRSATLLIAMSSSANGAATVYDEYLAVTGALR